MSRFVRVSSLSPSLSLSLLFLAAFMVSLATSADGQSVTTWHNDNNRTGWQQNESVLTPTAVSQSTFGLLWQYPNGTGGPIAGQGVRPTIGGGQCFRCEQLLGLMQPTPYSDRAGYAVRV